MKIQNFKKKVEEGEFDKLFASLYGNDSKALSYQSERYLHASQCFSSLFPGRDEIRVYSASGRTEIGGNHTDHQMGRVLAAAVDLDAIAVVSFHDDRKIRLKSE